MESSRTSCTITWKLCLNFLGIHDCRSYLGGAFDVETLVENLLRQMAGSQIIAVNVYDITNDTMPLVMYGHTNVERSDNTYVSLLDFGDPLRNHEMRCRCVT